VTVAVPPPTFADVGTGAKVGNGARVGATTGAVVAVGSAGERDEQASVAATSVIPTRISVQGSRRDGPFIFILLQ